MEEERARKGAGDVLRQVADTKGTGHSPTPGYFIPCLVYLNPSRLPYGSP